MIFGENKVIPRSSRDLNTHISMLIVFYFFFVFGNTKICNVRDYGAKGDGKTLDTNAINTALFDPSCSVVLLDHGEFLSGSVRLQSNRELIIQEQATLLGARQNIDAYDHPLYNPWSEYQDFGHNHWRNALLWGINVTNVRISGGGTIDGRDLKTGAPVPNGAGDKLIGIQSSSHITLDHLFMTGTGHFALLATNIEHLTLENLVVRPHRDGFDIVSCRHVRMSNCDIQFGGDDCLVFKSDFSLGKVIDTYDVMVKDCVVGTNGTTGLEFGSETVGDFYDYLFENITVTSGGDAGIGMAIMDGSRVSNIIYRNIRIHDTTSAFQFTIGGRGSHPKNVGRAVGSIKDVLLENIVAHHCFDSHRLRNWTSTLDGQPVDKEHGITEVQKVGPGIVFHSVDLLQCPVGGGTEMTDPPYYPEHHYNLWYNIGQRPSYGFLLRNVKGVTFEKMSIGFETNDDRPAVIVTESSDVRFENLSTQRGKRQTFDLGIGDDVEDLEIVESPDIVTHKFKE